jgi:hypothetical protein
LCQPNWALNTNGTQAVKSTLSLVDSRPKESIPGGYRLPRIPVSGTLVRVLGRGAAPPPWDPLPANSMLCPRIPTGVRTAPAEEPGDDGVRAAARRRGAQHLPFRVVQVGTDAAPQEPKLSAGAQRIHPARPASSGARASRPPPGLGVIEGLRGAAAARVPRSADSGMLARALARSRSRHAPKYLGHAPSLRLAGHVDESPETTSSAPLPIPGFGAAWGHRAGARGGISGSDSTLLRSMGAKHTSRGRCSHSEHSPPTSVAAHTRVSASDAARDCEGCDAPEPSLHSSTLEERIKSVGEAEAEGGADDGGGGGEEGLMAGGIDTRIVDVRFRPLHLDKLLRQERPPARLQLLMLQGNGLRQLPASLGSFVGLCKLAVTWNELRYANNSCPRPVLVLSSATL